MLNLLTVIDFESEKLVGEEQRLLELLTSVAGSLPGIKSAHAGATLPRALNGGRVMWRLSFGSEADCLASFRSTLWQSQIAPALSPDRGISVDTVAYRADFADFSRGGDREGIWRCLVLSVDKNAEIGDVRQLEADLLLMPRYVSTIRNWSLGRVVSAQGRRPWTHVWEQEFDDMGGLEGEYMVHPIHWGLVDGWFDPECPQRIVDPFLIHAAFVIRGAVIA